MRRRSCAYCGPERVQLVSDERGWPVAYLYRAGGQVTRYDRTDALERQQVAHIKALNPRDDHYGLGCLDAAIGAASVHNRAAKWNKALLDNAARPSGALNYEPADGSVLSAEQFKRLKDELAAEFSGSGNAGRPLLLEGGGGSSHPPRACARTSNRVGFGLLPAQAAGSWVTCAEPALSSAASRWSAAAGRRLPIRAAGQPSTAKREPQSARFSPPSASTDLSKPNKCKQFKWFANVG
jgi:hypothetical protein